MQTPYYVFNIQTLLNAYSSLNEAICPDKLFYALKANGEDGILQALNTVDANFEVASIGELNKLIQLGVVADRIICSLPIKTKDMIDTMYQYGIRYFVFDNMAEYYKIAQFAPEAKRVLRIKLSNCIENTIEYGMSIDEFERLIQENGTFASSISGITFYLSKNKTFSRLLQAIDLSEQYLKRLNKGVVFNIGGNYRLPNEVEENYYDKLRRKLNEIREKYNCVVYAEPGRSVVKSSGKLICKVIGYKERSHFVYLDAGHPTGISYCPENIVNLSRNDPTEKIEYSFFDITCSHRLLFSLELPFRICEEDVLSLENFGSYSVCKHSNFHGWSKPETVFFIS